MIKCHHPKREYEQLYPVCVCLAGLGNDFWCDSPGQIALRADLSIHVINPGAEMVGMKPKDRVPSAAVKFFGAGTAACIADLITFPLDTAKVRLQVRRTVVKRELLFQICLIKAFLNLMLTIPECHSIAQIQGESREVKGASAMKYRGVFGTITTMVRTEGPRSLYNGLVAGLQRQMSFASVRIGLYDTMKQFYTRGTESKSHQYHCVIQTRWFLSLCLTVTNKHAAQVLGS